MTLEEMKLFLKIDFDDDDSLLLLMIEAAKEYIVDAIGKYDETSARTRILLFLLVSNMYETRSFTVDKSNEKVAYAVRSMVLQLQYRTGETE